MSYRNDIAIENALGDLPEIYKKELANRLYTAYTHKDASSLLRSNIEFVITILWTVLPKDVQIQIVRRVDQELSKGNVICTELAFSFVRVVGSTKYLSSVARKYKITPLVEELEKNLGVFKEEDRLVKELKPYAAVVPSEIIPQYVSALTLTYVGHMGSSMSWDRTDFYANHAVLIIPSMFENFDDQAAQAFVDCIKYSEILKRRIKTPTKLRRLRSLGNIILSRVSESFTEKSFLEALVDEEQEEEFFSYI